MAYQYSGPIPGPPDRGDLGLFSFRAPAADRYSKSCVFRLDRRAKSRLAFKTQYGYHIIKLVDRKPNEASQPTPVRPAALHQVQRGKRDELGMAYLDSIRTAYPVTVDTTVANYSGQSGVTALSAAASGQVDQVGFDDEPARPRDEK